MIYIISDPHFFHDRDFIWGNRGFNNVREMDETIMRNWNSIISTDDDVYMLGDFFVGTMNEDIIRENIMWLNGDIHVIKGNHDTKSKVKIYESTPNVIEVLDIKMLNYKGYRFYLTHKKISDKNRPKGIFYNIHGHTHFKNKFENGYPYDYNASLDATDMKPISLDEIISDIEECKRRK